jgi:transcriptional regulator with XRE-family HTH domain
VAATTDAIPRRSGIRLDAGKLDHELSRRGVTARRLAEVSGVPEVTLSRARHGRLVNESTLRRLSTGLLQIPLLVGADLLIAEPEKKTTDARSLASVEQEASASGHPTEQ